METPRHFDIIIMGGGIAGSLCALEIKYQCPQFNIMIIEKSTNFSKKVGESCADVTSIYFRRRPHLLPIIQRQLHKTGLRFWFHEQKDHSLYKFEEYSSPSYKSIANGWQLNRGQFDQDLLDECAKQGMSVLRPADVTNIITQDFHNQIEVEKNDEKMHFTSTWLIDASGRIRIMDRFKDWLHENKNHQTATIWAWFHDLKLGPSWDTAQSKVLDVDTIQPRYNVTGHFMRHGLWWWHIPLNDNTISLGVVYDKAVHTEKNPRKLFHSLIDNDKALKDLVKDASYDRLLHYPQLSYLPHQMYSKGQLTVGDAASFIDPLFSPGIETSIQQILNIAEIFKMHELKSEKIHQAFFKYEKKFIRSLKDRSYTYEQKYKVMGSYDVFSTWTSMDFVGYYFFHIFPSSIFPSWLKRPVMLKGPLKPIYTFLKWRYLTIAEFRRINELPSRSLKQAISYSHVKVKPFPSVLTKYIELPLVWLKRYVNLEKDYFIEKYATKHPRKKKLGSSLSRG